jgi:hypothetical protein
MQASTSSVRWKWIGSHRGALALLAMLLLGSASPAGADLVTLKGARTVRAVAVMRHGEASDLQLLSGGTLTVPNATIEAIETESVVPEICSASPYRCQDRGMLLSRRARARGALPEAAPAPPADAKTPS